MIVTKEFEQATDKLIAAFKKKIKNVENGNLFIAKHVMEEKTKGGIIITEKSKELENRRSGYGRVLAKARNIKTLDSEGQMTGDADVEVGDYVIFTHEAVYKPPHGVLVNRLGIVYPEDMIWVITDRDIITVFND